MKIFFRVLAIAAAAAAIHFLILGILMSASVGPHGRALRLLTSGAMSTYEEASSRAWFQAVEQSVMLDRFVLWPTTFLLASILSVLVVPKARWWHSIVIACAVLPLSVPEAVEFKGIQLPGSSAFSSWVSPLVELLAYALLVGFLTYLVRRLRALRATKSTAVQHHAATGSLRSPLSLISLGGAPKMKRRIIFILLLVLGVPLALLALGGLGYYREVGYGEFVPPHLANEVRNPDISILSTRLTRVGFTDFLVFSVDGPPFELRMYGTAPDQRAGTSCQLTSLVVRADDTTLLSVSKKELPLNVKVQHGHQPALQGFFFSAPSLLSGTPQRLHVQGTITFPSSAGVTPVSFERVFELDASRRIVVGSFTWHL